MIKDPVIYKVTVHRRTCQNAAQRFKPRRTDVFGKAESDAWAEYLAGRLSAQEYMNICDKIKIMQRSQDASKTS